MPGYVQCKKCGQTIAKPNSPHQKPGSREQCK